VYAKTGTSIVAIAFGLVGCGEAMTGRLSGSPETGVYRTTTAIATDGCKLSELTRFQGNDWVEARGEIVSVRLHSLGRVSNFYQYDLDFTTTSTNAGRQFAIGCGSAPCGSATDSLVYRSLSDDRFEVTYTVKVAAAEEACDCPTGQDDIGPVPIALPFRGPSCTEAIGYEFDIVDACDENNVCHPLLGEPHCGPC
jgi:hypothetical protein